MKLLQQLALAVSDGENVGLALDSRKQWSKVPATSLSDDSDEEHDARVASRDLQDYLENIMLHRLLALSKIDTGQNRPGSRDLEASGFRTGPREGALLPD